MVGFFICLFPPYSLDSLRAGAAGEQPNGSKVPMGWSDAAGATGSPHPQVPSRPLAGDGAEVDLNAMGEAGIAWSGAYTLYAKSPR